MRSNAGLTLIGLGRRWRAVPTQGQAPAGRVLGVVAAGISRRQCQCHAEIGAGAPELSLALVDEPALDQGGDEEWVKPDRLAVVRDGEVESALVAPGAGAPGE